LNKIKAVGTAPNRDKRNTKKLKKKTHIIGKSIHSSLRSESKKKSVEKEYNSIFSKKPLYAAGRDSDCPVIVVNI